MRVNPFRILDSEELSREGKVVLAAIDDSVGKQFGIKETYSLFEFDHLVRRATGVADSRPIMIPIVRQGLEELVSKGFLQVVTGDDRYFPTEKLKTRYI